MKHEIKAPGPRQFGFRCTCGKSFPVEAAANAHVVEANADEARRAKQAEAQTKQESIMPEQPKPENQEGKPAQPAAPKTAETEKPAAEAKPAPEAKKPEQPAKSDAVEGEVLPRNNGRNLATQISNMDIADQMVLKYATTLINSEAAAEFQTRMKLIQRLNPKLAQVSPQSLFTAMMACVHLNLMPNTTEQLAHIIPYGNEAQFQIGYKGLAELAYRTGKVVKIDQEVVFKGDEFDWSLGLDRKLVHKPSTTVDRTKYENVVAAYSTITLTDGNILFEVVTRAELDKIKNSAKASGPGTPWAVWPVEMAKKTATRRLAKLLPTSKTDNRIQVAAELDSLQEAGKRLAIDVETGEITAADKNALAPELEQAIAEAKDKKELEEVLNGLSVPERKAVANLAANRLKELA